MRIFAADRKRRGIAFLVMALLLLAGCGNSGDASTSHTEAQAPLTKSRFVREGNAICRKGLGQKDHAVRVAGRKLSSQEQEEPSALLLEKLVSEAVLPPFERIVAQLAELSPPAADSSRVQKFIKEFEVALSKAKGDPKTLVRGEPFASASEAASDYGLILCRL